MENQDELWEELLMLQVQKEGLKNQIAEIRINSGGKFGEEEKRILDNIRFSLQIVSKAKVNVLQRLRDLHEKSNNNFHSDDQR